MFFFSSSLSVLNILSLNSFTSSSCFCSIHLYDFLYKS